MTVARLLSTGQNAEPPDAETSRGPKLYELPQERLNMGSHRWSHFQHASGLNARGMPSMSQNDNAPGGRSPSGWHDDTTGRDAGHDDLQRYVWQKFNQRRGQAFSDSKSSVLLECIAEAPIIDPRSGRILAFADIAIRWNWRWQFIELKPRIYSCGGLIRQCRAISAAAERAGLVDCRVSALVYDDDPKVGMLRELYWDVMAWPRAGFGSAAA